MSITEKDIREGITALQQAIRREDQDGALAVGLQLIAQALVDLHRIADALEELAEKD